MMKITRSHIENINTCDKVAILDLSTPEKDVLLQVSDIVILAMPFRAYAEDVQVHEIETY